MSEMIPYTLGQVTANFDFLRIPVRAADRVHGVYPYYGASGVIDYVDRYNFEGEYLLVAEDGENLRSRKTPIAFIARGKFWANNHVHVLQGGVDLNIRYLCYAFSRLDVSGYLTGSTQPKLTQTALNAIQISLPPYSLQVAVARILGALDDKIVANDRVSSIGRDLMRALFCAQVAIDRREVAVGDIGNVYDGPHATPEKVDVGPWFLSISSLVDGRLELSSSAHVGEEDYVKWTRRVTPSFGDVLFSYETRLGEAALMPKGIRACLGRRMALLRPKSIDSRIFLQAFLFVDFQRTIKERSVRGATVDRIPLTEFSRWPIIIPGVGLNALAEKLGALDDLIASNDRSNENLVDLRDALLPKLMSGEIRVRDAEKIVEDVT